MNTGTGHSFVYPVRSLLTGDILPAGQGEQPPADHQSSRRRRKRNARGLGRGHTSPNFRHYPSNATAPVQVVLNPPSSTPSTADNGNVSDPDSLSFYPATTDTSSPLSESSPRHPQNIPEVTSDVPSGSANPELYPRSRHPQQIDLSDTSIVHLPPPRNATLHFAHNQGIPSHSGSSQHQSLYGALPSSYEDDTSFTVNLEGQGGFAHPLPSSSSIGSGSDAHETAGSGNSVSSSGYSSSDEPLVTFRFEHREDGNGHHVVIGREGKLSQCEDEVRTSTL